MLGHYRHKKVVRFFGVICLISVLVGVTHAQDRREQIRQRRSQAQSREPQRRHTPAANPQPQSQRPAAPNNQSRQNVPRTASPRSSPSARSRAQSTGPTVRITPISPRLQAQRSPSASSRPSITPQRPTVTGPAAQRSGMLQRSYRSRSFVNTRRYVLDNSRFHTSAPSSLTDSPTSQPFNTRNPSALLGRQNAETHRVNIPSTTRGRGIQGGDRNRRNPVTVYRSQNERNPNERQRITETPVQRDRRALSQYSEDNELLQRLRQGRSRAQADTGVRRYEPIGPATRHRSGVRSNQGGWQGETSRPRVVVDAAYHRQQARQYRFIRHYPNRIVYHDRPGQFNHGNRYLHVYNSHNRLFHQIVWPNFRFCVTYGYGSRLAFRYVYPHYHRKYVFVSLGGFWPSYEHCLRYYWYGWHPYDWYGYDPIPRQVNNYYTYNYYDDSQPGVDSGVVENLEPSPPPPYQGPGDRYFEEAVIAFEDGKYMVAANLFRQAMLLDPNDIIVPFAYTQALFAEKEYLLSVMSLREALDKIDPNNSTIFYPRGLYADDETLFRQIDELMVTSDQNPQDRNLKLLLGYHLLGIEEVESAAGYLEQAGRDGKNAQSANLLLNLIRTVRESQTETEVSEIEP